MKAVNNNNANKVTFPPRKNDGYFAKDKNGKEFQFAWSADDKLFIKRGKKAVEVNKNDYEIIEK